MMTLATLAAKAREEGRLWTCEKCRGWFGLDDGASDNPPEPCRCGYDHLNLCDACWLRLEHSKRSETE
jgi:hypothetical protein